MTLDELNALSDGELDRALAACCGARRWVRDLMARRPFADLPDLLAAAGEAADGLQRDDWLEAFRRHPRIGDAEALRARLGTRSGSWSQAEQAGAARAGERILQRLASGNQRYEDRFGFVFIVCARGKSADEMLAILESRLPNQPAEEWRVAAAEQREITRLRLEALVDVPAWGRPLS